MRICHACKRELDAAALAAGRCGHCGAVVPTLAKRTIEDKRSPHEPDAENDASKTVDTMATAQSIDLPADEVDRPGATIELSHSDTAGDVGAARPDKPPAGKASDPERGADSRRSKRLTINCRRRPLTTSDRSTKKPGRRSRHD
jgi:hypothetical protein